MTALTEGMTPAQFLTALNDSYTEYWGTGGVADILSTDGYVAAINAKFGETVVAFGQRGYNFAGAVNGKFNTFTHLLEDDCEDADIDPTKWEVLNLDTGSASFEQSVDILDDDTGITTNEKWQAGVMNSLPAASAVLMFRNRRKSLVPFSYGSVTFDLLKIFKGNSRVYVGLFSVIDETLGTDSFGDRIYFSAYNDDMWKFSIMKDGVEVYSIADIARSYIRVQIVRTPENNILLYVLSNKTWVQLGETQTQDLGDLYFCQSTEGYYAGQVSFREFWMTSRKFSTIRPGIANEASPFGTADGTTDNSSAINAALSSGDVYLKDGIFLYSASIKNPSNRYIHLKNAVLKAADGSLDNLWRNSDFDGGNVNVGIVGHGHAILDGNSENNDDGYLTYSNLEPGQNFETNREAVTEDTYRYFFILPCNVNGFEFSGLSIVDHPHWNIITQFATNGVIKNIFSNHHFTTTPSNQDGMGTIAWGSKHIKIFNFKSTSDDDFVCPVACRPDYAIVQIGPAKVGDVEDIKFKDCDIYGSGGSGARIIITDGNKLNGFGWRKIKQYTGYNNLVLGYPQYAIVPSVMGDIKNIVVDDVIIKSNVEASVIQFKSDCQNVAFTNIDNDSGKTLFSYDEGVVLDNVTNEGVELP